MSQSQVKSLRVNLDAYLGDWAMRTGKIGILAPDKTDINFEWKKNFWFLTYNVQNEKMLSYMQTM